MCIVLPIVAPPRRLGQRLLDHSSSDVALRAIVEPLERAQTLDGRGAVVALAALYDEVPAEQMRVPQRDEHSVRVALRVQLDECEATRCAIGLARQPDVLDLGVSADRSAEGARLPSAPEEELEIALGRLERHVFDDQLGVGQRGSAAVDFGRGRLAARDVGGERLPVEDEA